MLEIDGERTSDSTDILYRLDALYPEPPLLAPDPQIAELQRQLEDWADESFLWYFLQYFRLRDESAEEDAASGRARRLPRLLRWTLAWFRSGGTWERRETGLLRGLEARLDDLVKFLRGRPFFYADRPSIADLAVYGMLHSMLRGAIPDAIHMVSERAPLMEFMQRLEKATEAGEASRRNP